MNKKSKLMEFSIFIIITFLTLSVLMLNYFLISETPNFFFYIYNCIKSGKSIFINNIPYINLLYFISGNKEYFQFSLGQLFDVIIICFIIFNSQVPLYPCIKRYYLMKVYKFSYENDLRIGYYEDINYKDNIENNFNYTLTIQKYNRNLILNINEYINKLNLFKKIKEKRIFIAKKFGYNIVFFNINNSYFIFIISIFNKNNIFNIIMFLNTNFQINLKSYFHNFYKNLYHRYNSFLKYLRNNFLRRLGLRIILLGGDFHNLFEIYELIFIKLKKLEGGVKN